MPLVKVDPFQFLIYTGDTKNNAQGVMTMPKSSKNFTTARDRSPTPLTPRQEKSARVKRRLELHAILSEKSGKSLNELVALAFGLARKGEELNAQTLEKLSRNKPA